MRAPTHVIGLNREGGSRWVTRLIFAPFIVRRPCRNDPLVKFLVQEGSDLRLPDPAELTGGEIALILACYLYSLFLGL